MQREHVGSVFSVIVMITMDSDSNNLNQEHPANQMIQQNHLLLGQAVWEHVGFFFSVIEVITADSEVFCSWFLEGLCSIVMMARVIIFILLMPFAA